MFRELRPRQKVGSLVIAAIIMAIGLIAFKFIPMNIFGEDILFDMSMHLTVTMFALYVLWYFIDHNPSWRLPYLILAFVVITIVSVQRIIDNAHNDVGLLIAFVISALAIIVSRWSYFHGKFKF